MAFSPKKIFVCTDFSPQATAAADAAADLAKLTGGTLTLVHVVPLSTYVEFADGLGQTVNWNADVQASVNARADAALKKEAERLSTASWKVSTLKSDGAPQIEIAKLAEQEHADLVVAGSHGRTGLSHVLVGSVAEGIVRHCKCPVLVFHG